MLIAKNISDKKEGYLFKLFFFVDFHFIELFAPTTIHASYVLPHIHEIIILL
jgi:hypothetical protein